MHSSISSTSLSRTDSARALERTSSSGPSIRPAEARGRATVEGSPALEAATRTEARADRLDVTGHDLGGKGGTINKIRQVFRDMLFGSSADRKASATDKTTGRTELQDHQDALRGMRQVSQVTITTSDGVSLRGHFASPGSKPNGTPDLTKPVVLLLTGSGGCAEEQGADILKSYSNRRDVNVLSVNYRGYGDSGGKPTEKGLYKDGQAMFQHLLDQGFRSDQIVVHGYSMGATVAGRLHKMAEDNGIPLKGVVYDRPMGSTFKGTKAQTGLGPLGSLAGAMAKDAVGKMNAVSDIARGGAPRTPVVVTYDSDKLSGVGQRLGQRLHALAPTTQVVDTKGGHFDSATAMQNARPALEALLA